MNEKKLSSKTYFAIIVLAMLYAVTYSIPYIKYVFYDGMLELTGVSNAKLGVLMTIYGLGEMLTPGIGGVLAERYDYKKIILGFSLVSALACLALVFSPSFQMTLIVWGVLVFSTLFMIWGTWFKALRMLGPDSVQGRINGLYYGFGGVGYLIVNTICLFFYNKFESISPMMAMRSVFAVFAVLLVIFSIIAYFTMKSMKPYGVGQTDKEKEEDDEYDRLSIFEQFKVVSKERGVWYFGGALFCMYSTNIAITYFTPYFTNVLGTAVVFSGLLAIIRQYGMRAIGAPIGGWFADRIGSIAKVIIACTIGSLIMILMILGMPAAMKTVGVLTVIMLLTSLFNNLSCGIQYAIPVETKVKRKYHAAAVGMGSMIGFAPDVYQHVLFGNWLDKYGNAGYTYIFMYGAATAILGIIIMNSMVKYMKQKNEMLNVEENLNEVI